MTANQINDNIKSLLDKSNEEEKELLGLMTNVINSMCKKEKDLIQCLKDKIDLCEKTQESELKNKNFHQVELFNLRISTYKEVLSELEKDDE